jgi:hypothetical protein
MRGLSSVPANRGRSVVAELAAGSGGSQPVISKLHSLFFREELLEAKKSQHHLGASQKLCELVRFFGSV